MLEIRYQLEHENTGIYTGNIAWTSASLAKLLSTDKNRTAEVKTLCHEVLKIRQTLDSEHLGFSINDVAKKCQTLLDRISNDGCSKQDY